MIGRRDGGSSPPNSSDVNGGFADRLSQECRGFRYRPKADVAQVSLKFPIVGGYAAIMGYWIKRIALADGEVVTEQELSEDENRFDGPVPAIGDVIEVRCRGRNFMAEVVWGNPPGRIYPEDTVVPLRVFEVGLDPKTPLRFLRPSSTAPRK